jgi:hypothetical protein
MQWQRESDDVSQTLFDIVECGLTSPSTGRPWEFMYPNPWVSFFHPSLVECGEAMIPILIPGTSYLSRIDSIYPRVAWEISRLGAWLGGVRK